MRLIVYKNELVTNTVIMHLSCKCSWWTFLGTYFTYVLLQADSACKNVHNWYMMWYLKKDMFWKEHIFSDDSSFLKRSVHRPFFGRSGRHLSSSGHVLRGTCLCIYAYFVHKWNFTIACAIAFSDRVHDRTNDLFDQSSVWTPGLARDQFLWVQGSNPSPCSTIMGSGFDSLALIACF